MTKHTSTDEIPDGTPEATHPTATLIPSTTDLLQRIDELEQQVADWKRAYEDAVDNWMRAQSRVI
jgi:hypothetical protein